MKYEFRVWNDKSRMPKIKPQKAEGRLDAIKNAVQGDNRGNPDIIIDTNSVGEGAISSAEVSFFNAKIKENDHETAYRFIKMNINGNLYLPPDTSLTDAAKSIAGSQGVENKKRDTVLLSKWASAKPTDVVNDGVFPLQPYYRAVILSIMTKAGDFRVITADNMYIESYSENYAEGEFGTFKLTLSQKIDAESKFTVAGLASEPVSVLSKIGKGIKVAAEVAVVGGAVVKSVTETVEIFTGETEATRKIKGISTATSSAGNVTKNTSNLFKDIKNKNTNNLSKDITDLSDSTKNVVKDSKTAHNNATIPLSDLEAEHLSWIKKKPEDYEKYLNSSPSEKRKMLEKAAEEKLDRAKVTKYYEESSIDINKAKKAEEDMEKEKKQTPTTNATNTTKGVNLNAMIDSAAGKKNGDSK